jgi:hypothetical protein
MILGIPLAILFGFLTIIFILITASFGIAFHIFRKNVFKYHQFFAFTTIFIATVNLILLFLFWFKKIII